MTARKKTVKSASKKLKVKKETLKDLGLKRGVVKGGAAARTDGMMCRTNYCESKFCHP